MSENATVDLIKLVKKGVVLIDTQVTSGGQKRISIKGSGFIINKGGYIVSCAHVFNSVPDQEKPFLGVAVWNGVVKGITSWKRFPLKLIEKNDREDIALFQFDGNREIEVLGLGLSREVEEGEDVILLGFPLAIDFLKMNLGITLATKKTIISAVKRRKLDKSIHFFQIDTHISPEFSGAPVLRLVDGKVIGLAAGHFGKKYKKDGEEINIPEMMGIVRPVSEIKKMLGKCDLL